MITYNEALNYIEKESDWNAIWTYTAMVIGIAERYNNIAPDDIENLIRSAVQKMTYLREKEC